MEFRPCCIFTGVENTTLMRMSSCKYPICVTSNFVSPRPILDKGCDLMRGMIDEVMIWDYLHGLYYVYSQQIDPFISCNWVSLSNTPTPGKIHSSASSPVETAGAEGRKY
jgi:hypothetical protein